MVRSLRSDATNSDLMKEEGRCSELLTQSSQVIELNWSREKWDDPIYRWKLFCMTNGGSMHHEVHRIQNTKYTEK
jgi:hypothetical protein